MRKRYPTDLSDAEWEYIEPHLPIPRAAGRPRRHSLRERSLTPSSTSCVAAVLGACCRMSFLLGRPSTATSEPGVSTAPGRACTLSCASVCEYASREILNQVQA